MMQRLIPVIALAVGCGGCGALQDSSEHKESCLCEEQIKKVDALQYTLEECEEEKASIEKAQEPKTIVRTKVVEKEGPPKKCATDLPAIKPVKTVECKKGYVCLNGQSQRILLKNELAYRKWIQGVLSCQASSSN